MAHIVISNSAEVGFHCNDASEQESEQRSPDQSLAGMLHNRVENRDGPAGSGAGGNLKCYMC
jgi:hypothetical protein